MKTMNRREAVGVLSAMAFVGALGDAQTTESSTLTASKVFKFGATPETFNAAGGGSSQTLPRTILPSGEVVGVHVGTIPPKTIYSPMHANNNCEFIIIHEGKLEFMSEGNPTWTAEKGDVVYASAHEKHSLRNPGDTKMTYFVVAVGGPKPVAKT